MVKRLSVMQETWVLSLGWEDPREKAMASDSSTLSWKIPWTEEPGGLQSTWSQRVRHNLATPLHFSLWDTNTFRNQARVLDVPRYWQGSRATSGSVYLGCACEVARKGEGKPAET